MYLVDTNVWLERFLEQEKAEDVRRFLETVASDEMFVTDFALHSIGIALTRLGQEDALLRFVRDAFVDGAVTLIHLEPEATERIVQAMGEFKLDFGDAYQYVAAEKHDLILVSFDSHFDRTARGRKDPAEVLKGQK